MDKNKALAKAMEYCARSEKSRNEVRSFLEKNAASEQDIDDILATLVEEKFIDELRYAMAYVADKYRFNSWGKIKISYNLSSKGIAPAIIREALDSLDPDEY